MTNEIKKSAEVVRSIAFQVYASQIMKLKLETEIQQMVRENKGKLEFEDYIRKMGMGYLL